MIEYGIPLHAFDRDKLDKDTETNTLLNIRKAKSGESMTTWQGTELKLSSKDLIISSGDKPVGIAGIIGGANSDIDAETHSIILEAACYNQASIRRTALRHALRTDASTRHEKYLNPEMVATAIRRALFLILDLAGGEIVKIEDYYPQKVSQQTVEFNLLEIPRIGGIEIETEEVISLLNRLGFEILEQKEAIGLNQHILIIKVPEWRTDVQIQADVLEEILRLWGYDKIPLQPITQTPPDYTTPVPIQLEEKIRDLLVNLGLDEHITSPLVKSSGKSNEQIVLENPLNKDADALRLTITETLQSVADTYEKIGKETIALFETGKIYTKIRQGEYQEEKLITTLYSGCDFILRVKPDFLTVLSRLGFDNNQLTWIDKEQYLEYFYENKHVATLRSNGFDLLIETISKHINIRNVPVTHVKSGFWQRIIEEISLVVPVHLNTGEIAKVIYEIDPQITEVKTVDVFKDETMRDQEFSITISIKFENSNNQLTREFIQNSRDKIIKAVAKLGVKPRT